jgi:O-methyltransferase involved in polyketide biosynthesis
MAVFRSVFFDRMTRAFFERHPDGVGINIACGLGTNYERAAADAGDEVTRFDVDLPEVIEIRRRFFAHTERRQAVEGDLQIRRCSVDSSPSWADGQRLC